jgi:starch synthase
MQSQLDCSVAILATSRFHYHQLALQLIRHGMLSAWVTALPLNKIPSELHDVVISKPFSLYLYLFSQKICQGAAVHLFPRLAYYSNQYFDRQAIGTVLRIKPSFVIGLSHNICLSGITSQSFGAQFFCDVPIAELNWLNEVLREEHLRIGLPYAPIDQRQIEMEATAHHAATKIVCPSSYVKRTLVASGVSSEKIAVIPYGSAQVSRFKNSAANFNASSDLSDAFTVLFVGQVSLRKGVPYLLDAFARFRHPNKSLLLAGALTADSHAILSSYCLDHVSVLGIQTKEQLHTLYSMANVFVLPSVAEGLALVVGEAMSYGLPVIHTYETGACDILDHGIEGVMIESRSSDAILNALESLSDDPNQLHSMSMAARVKSQTLSGWDSYGDKWKLLLEPASA